MFIFLGKKRTTDIHNNTYKLQMFYGKRKKLDSNTTQYMIPFMLHSGKNKTV